MHKKSRNRLLALTARLWQISAVPRFHLPHVVNDTAMDELGSQKIKIKIGGAEFEAEGPTGLLKEQFERFMSVVEKIGGPSVVGQGALVAPAPLVNGTGVVTPAANPANPPADPAATPVGDDLIARLFRRDGDGVSLLALPRTDEVAADALVALLYGYQRLANRSAVTGVSLMKAAKQSGVNIPRVDTVIAKRDEYVLAAGTRRGKVYSLNNRGVQYAEGVLRRTLE